MLIEVPKVAEHLLGARATIFLTNINPNLNWLLINKTGDIE